jgi:hypothetical protein
MDIPPLTKYCQEKERRFLPMAKARGFPAEDLVIKKVSTRNVKN